MKQFVYFLINPFSDCFRIYFCLLKFLFSFAQITVDVIYFNSIIIVPFAKSKIQALSVSSVSVISSRLYLLHSSLFVFICNTNRLFLSFPPSFLSYQQVLSVLSENSDLLIDYYMTDQGTIFSGQYEGEREKGKKERKLSRFFYINNKEHSFSPIFHCLFVSLPLHPLCSLSFFIHTHIFISFTDIHQHTHSQIFTHTYHP